MIPNHTLFSAALMLLGLLACSRGADKDAASAATDSVASVTSDASSATAALSSGPPDAPAPSGGESTAGTTITVTNATPASGNGATEMPAVASLGAFGGGRTFQTIGRTGEMERYIALAFDADGSVASLALVWSNDDNSVHVTVGCAKGTPNICAKDKIIADAKTGAATFKELLLKGTDAKDSSVAVATLTGEIR